MANDTFTANADGKVFAGMFTPETDPVWRQAISPTYWGTVAAANLLSDLNPTNDPLINPNYPGNHPAHGVGGWPQIIAAWSGGSFDYLKDQLALNGTGHTDAAYNCWPLIDLYQDEPFWYLPRPPTGSIGNTGVLNDGLEATGIYFDGQPRAIHSYCKVVFIPGIGHVIFVQGNCYFSGQAGTNDTLILDTETGLCSRINLNPRGSGTSGYGCAYDPTRNVVWTKGAATGKFGRTVMDGSSSELVGATVDGSSYSGLCYMDDIDAVLCVRDGAVYLLNCTTYAWIQLSFTGALVGSVFAGKMQPRYFGNGRVAVWDNTSNTTQINVLHCDGNPFVDPWTITQLPVAPGNTVTPTVRTENGTYGRFFYSPNLRGFGLINAVNQPIYFYALE